MFDLLRPQPTGLPTLDAEADFLRARRGYHAARLTAWLRRCRCSRRLRSLSPSALLSAGAPRLEVIPLHAVVGAVEDTVNFDSDFRPASNALRWRWERIALAHRTGKALPPVVLRRQPDGYYVVDGRHRISVARALRHRDIDAWVSGPPLERQPPTTSVTRDKGTANTSALLDNRRHPPLCLPEAPSGTATADSGAGLHFSSCTRDL
jgi:hypothetical protein